MASHRHRRPSGDGQTKQVKDRVYAARKADIEQMIAKEADIEARTLASTRKIVVMCAHCLSKSEHDLGDGVPVAPCPVCGQRLTLRPTGGPHVVTR